MLNRPASDRGGAKRLLILISAATALDVVFFTALAPLLPYYASHLGLTKPEAGLLSALYGVGISLFALPAAVVIDKRGPRPTVLIGLAAFTAATITFATNPGIEVLYCARTVQGIGAACVWEGGLVWAVSICAPERRGELMGKVVGIAIAGSLLGPVVGTTARLIGPGLCFSLVAATAALLAVCIAGVPAGYSHMSPPPRMLVPAVGLTPRIVTNMWFTMLPAAIYGTLTVLAPLRLAALGAGGIAIGAAFFLSAGAEAGVTPVVGRLCDRAGPFALLKLALVIMLGVVILVPLSRSVLELGALIVVAGMSLGAAWVPANAVLSAGVKATALGESFAFALWMIAWSAGQGIGAVGSAQLAQATDDVVPYAALAVCCGLTLIPLLNPRRHGRNL